MPYKHNSDCFHGLKISTRKLKLILLNISIQLLTLFGDMMLQVPSPHAPSSLYLLGLRSALSSKPLSLFKCVFWIYPACNIQLLPQSHERLFSVLKKIH